MSLLPSATFYSPSNPIYLKSPLEISSISVSTLNANRITANSTISGFIEGSYGEYSNFYVDNTLYVNFQALTADADELFLNGIALATTANLSSIQDWSIYAQTSTLDGNNQSTIGLSLLEASTLKTLNLVASNIFTQNLMAYNIVNFTSTVVEVYESTIQSDVKLANISTANIKNLYVSSGNFSTLNSINASFNNVSAGTTTVNTITGISASFSNFVASTITVSSIVSPPVTAGSFSSITVVSNTNTGSLTVGSNNVTTFAAAPTFSDGANFNGTRPNFNSGINTTAANNFNNTTLDNVGRITANTVFIGSSNYVNIQTSSFTEILNNRGADVGGNSVIDLKSRFGAATRVNITADASSALSPTPTQIVSITANGATSLTQNAVGGRVSIVANAGSGAGCNILGFGQIDLTAFSSLPFAGVIKESAGSILAYSGLTVPSVGVFGGSFYSALTTLSLTCGVTPATTSYPGVVFLRGDNGTKVINGFDVDNITLSSINGSAYPPPASATVSTFTTLRTSSFTVSSINGSSYPPTSAAVSTFTNLATSSFTVSSINGVAYSPGGGGWVSTATTPLFMSDKYIDLRPEAFGGINGLAWGSVAPYSVGVDGPYLFGYTQGALGTTSNSNDISLAWDTNKVEMYKPMDMNGNGIGDGGGFLTLSSITVGIVASTSIGLLAGNNTESSFLNLTQTNIDLVASTVTRSLAGVYIPQPVIQYGTDTVSGASGSVAVTLGTPYASVSSYVAFISMLDSIPAETSVTRNSDSQITLSWNSGGGGTHTLAWQTLGT